MTDDITLINAYAIIITTVSTIILALITIFYAIETHKMRIGAKAPMLSIQCDFAFGEDELPRKLYLCNYGPVAQNLSINAEVKVDNASTVRKKYLYSMAQGERTEIVDDFYKVKDRSGEIVVRMKYYDANMKQYRSEIIVDFNQMTADRIISVPESASTEISDIGDLLRKLPGRQ
ncbi:MAG TPA: hypothetical protein VLY83_03405 [Methanoregula sp.]|nr:hypothetical protein [Methanoregula sp.]